MDTTATIPTGSMAERWKFKSFIVWGLFCGAVYYPLFGAWTWGGGWLSQLGNSLDLGFGYVDFAGTDVRFTVAAVNTGIAAAFVIITAPCAFIDPWAAAASGVIGGLVVIEAVFVLEKRGLDDSSATADTGVTGILHDPSPGLKQLGARAVGALVIWTVMFGLAYETRRLGVGSFRCSGDRCSGDLCDNHPRGLSRPPPGPARRNLRRVRDRRVRPPRRPGGHHHPRAHHHQR